MIKPISQVRRSPFKKKEGPTDVDIHVGKQIRLRRSLLGMTQESIAQATGLTFQQIQKYEQGKNRVSASRLLQLAQLLNVDPNFFFESLINLGAPTRVGLAEDAQDALAGPASKNMMTSRETIELLRAYYAIPDIKLRKNILKMMKQMTEGSADK